jgi:signal transduction histidine kinase
VSPGPLNRRGILARALLLAALGAIASVLVLGWAASGAFRDLSAQVLRERGLLAAAVADHVEHELRREIRALHGVFPASAGPSAQTELHDTYVASRRLAGVFLRDEAGTVVWEDGRKGIAALLPRPEDLRGAGAGEGATLSGTVETASRERFIWLTAPFESAGGRALFAGELLDPKNPALRSLLAPDPPGEGASVDLVDAGGTVLVTTDPGRSGGASGHAELVGQVLRERGHASAIREGDVAAAAHVTTLPWAVLIRQPETEALSAAATLRWRLAALAPVLFAVTALFAWGAARSLRRPLALLNSAAGRIASGDLEEPIPSLADDEVGRLGASLESMRTALARSMDEVRLANLDLERRVAERTRELTALSQRLETRDAQRRQLLRRVIGAQEDERKRIARELHDETCQMVASVSMRLDAALDAPAPELPRRIADTRALAGATLDGLHRLIFDLRPSVLDDLGLLPAIRWYAARQLEPRGVSVRCETEGEERRLPLEVETAVFRIVQEAINNVARHSEAGTVLIQIALGWDRLSIEIEDDGKGFDPADTASPAPTGRGLGLLGMRERVELLGGTLTLDSSPGQGTRLALSVPILEEASR